VEDPPLRLRGRILELGGASILSNFQLQPGRHTISFANDRHRYRFVMVQAGSDWFNAELRRQPFSWMARLRETLGF
jgi:hypothetical protein